MLSKKAILDNNYAMKGLSACLLDMKNISYDQNTATTAVKLEHGPTYIWNIEKGKDFHHGRRFYVMKPFNVVGICPRVEEAIVPNCLKKFPSLFLLLLG